MGRPPQTRHWCIILLIILGAFTVPMLNPGIPKSHDGEVNIARFAAYDKAFADRHIPPRWAGDLNYRFGSPVFNFFYPLPGYLSAAISPLGLSYENRFKILISVSFILAGLHFFWWMKQHVADEYAFLGALIYGLLPYHFLNLYIRGDIGELVALAVIPLIFLSADRNSKRISAFSFSALSGTTALLILAHNGISLIFLPVIILYTAVSAGTGKKGFGNFTAVLFGLALASWFWLPALTEQKYTHAALFIGDMYKQNFVTPIQLIWSTWGNGAAVADPQGLSPQLGILPVLLLILSVFYFNHRTAHSKRILFFLGITTIALFMMISSSSSIWRALPMLQKLQFPWRMMALASFAAACAITLSLPKFGRRTVILCLLPLVCLFSLPMATAIPEVITHSDEYYKSYNGPTDFHGQSSTVWSAGNPAAPPEHALQVVEGNSEIRELYRSTIEHRYSIHTTLPSKLVESTLYYPGWTVTANGIPVPIEFQDPAARGLITFPLSSGEYSVSIKFGETKFRTATNLISVFSIGAWCMILGIGIIKTLRVHETN